MKLKSNSMGIFAVSVLRFTRWLMGSKESRCLNENRSNQGNAAAYHRVAPCKPSRHLLPEHAGNAPHATVSKNSAYAGASGAHRLAWRSDSVALVAKYGEPLQRGFPASYSSALSALHPGLGALALFQPAAERRLVHADRGDDVRVAQSIAL